MCRKAAYLAKARGGWRKWLNISENNGVIIYGGVMLSMAGNDGGGGVIHKKLSIYHRRRTDQPCQRRSIKSAGLQYHGGCHRRRSV
jgi:hypothetical protein